MYVLYISDSKEASRRFWQEKMVSLTYSYVLTRNDIIMTSYSFARSLYGRYHLRDFNELDHELALRYI